MIFNENLDYDPTQESNEYSFYVYGIPVEYLNSIRRTIMTDCSKYSFGDINFKINTTLINDDIMRNRFEMIPILCDDEYIFTLNIKNTDKKFLDVYSKDIVCCNFSSNCHYDKNILLATLKNGESLNVEMKTIKKRASEHVKYRTTNVVFYKTMKRLVFLSEERKQEVVDFLENQYDMKIINNEYVFDTCRTNLNIPKIVNYTFGKDLVKLENYTINGEQVYYFNIECDYYNPKLILENALELLKSRVNNITYTVKRVNEDKQFYLNLENESSTSANILQLELNKYEEIEFSYFYKLYPLDKDIELQIFFKEPNVFEGYLKETQETVCKMLDSYFN